MDTNATTGTNLDEAEKPASLPARIAYLDSLRGLTALYVVMYHCYFMEVTAFDIQKNFTLMERLRINWLGLGEEAMAVFLVISGYCLMRPVLANGGKIPQGIGGFLLHRAKRLLPPYYIVIALLLLLIKTVPEMDRINKELFTYYPQGDNFSPGVLASHFLLFDNVKYFWKFSIDPPAWSVATMWWTYVLFALVLLPIWRKAGSVMTAIVLLIVTLVPHFVFHGLGDVASPWFIGIFAIGMAAAAQSFSAEPSRALHRRVWLMASVLLFAVCAFIGLVIEKWMWDTIFAIDILVGCAAACLIVYCTERLKAKAVLPFPLNILETKPLGWLGRISYSLFLVHFPTLWMIHAHVTAKMEAPAFTKLGVLMATGIPASILLAWLFHWAVERRFMRAQSSF